MWLFEKFVTEGNEKADESAKDGAMMDGAVMARIGAQHSPAGKRGGLCCVAPCSQLSLSGGRLAELKPKTKERWTFVDKNVDAQKSVARNGVRWQTNIAA